MPFFVVLFQEAEVSGQVVPEPFDVRTEEGLEAGTLLMDTLETSQDSGRSSGQDTVHLRISYSFGIFSA